MISLFQSTMFLDADNDGLKNRIAWAGAGTGVLFFDGDDSGTISETKEFIFTEWDPTATSDLAALASVFDTNGDGVLDAADAGFGQFRVLETKADGTYEARTLAQLGIANIDLIGDATEIELPDGSVITAQSAFTRTNGTPVFALVDT